MNWISVKDELPHVPDGSMGVEVLVFTVQGNWLVGLYGSDGTWTLYNSMQVCHPGEVTHWCEIVPPEAPKALFRFHRGSLAKSMETVVEVRDKNHLLETVCKELGAGGTLDVFPENSTIEIDASGWFDPRTYWTTFAVLFQSENWFKEKHVCGWINRRLDK